MATKKKNGFYSFLLMKQRTTPGWENKTNAELMELVSPIWCSMGAEQKARLSITNSFSSSRGFDSYGRSLEEIASRAAQEIKEDRKMNLTVKKMVDKSIQDQNLESEVFFLIHTNVFCTTEEGDVIPAEISVVRMSLDGGVEDVIHCFIEPGPIPRGYRADCVENAAARHKIPLDLVMLDPNYHELVDRIVLFISSHNSEKLPPLFCPPKFSQQNSKVLQWLVNKAGVVSPDFQIYSLPVLFSHLAKSDPRVPTVSVADIQLDRDLYIYTPGVACDYHTDVETSYCTSAMVRKWIYIISSICCPNLGLELKPGYHLPPTEASICLNSTTTGSIGSSSVNSSQEVSLRGWASQQDKEEDWEWEGLGWQGNISVDLSSDPDWQA